MDAQGPGVNLILKKKNRFHKLLLKVPHIMVHLRDDLVLSGVNWKQDHNCSALQRGSRGQVPWVWFSQSTPVLRLKGHNSLHQASPGYTLLHSFPSPLFTVEYFLERPHRCVRENQSAECSEANAVSATHQGAQNMASTGTSISTCKSHRSKLGHWRMTWV